MDTGRKKKFSLKSLLLRLSKGKKESTGEALRRSQLPIPELQLLEAQQDKEASLHDAQTMQKRTSTLTTHYMGTARSRRVQEQGT